jgi:hypothetical protein
MSDGRAAHGRPRPSLRHEPARPLADARFEMIDATCHTETRRDRVETGTDVARRRRRARCMKTRAERGSGRRRDHATACFRVGIPSPEAPAAESPDSRYFEQNSNRVLLHRIDKTSAKIRPPITADSDSRRPCSQNCEPARFARTCACYSCNTLPKRIVRAGETSAFSLCRGFG